MSHTQGGQPQQIVDHLFRHQAGKMIAVLTRIFGIHNLQLVEDTVQETFLKALQVWKYGALPDNPSAWLMRVARNQAINLIRRQQQLTDLSDELAALIRSDTEQVIRQFFLDTEIADSQLSMIFTCCHPDLKQGDQVALTLNTVSGFGIREIARALVSSQAAIQKRLHRAKEQIKKKSIQFGIPGGIHLHHRLETVYTVLYLLFNEGYHSIRTDELIRYDLCREAMRLCKLLSEHPVGKQPTTFALLSLMCFQASRFDSRIGDDNAIILLEQQDRKKWDQELIQTGCDYLHQAATGDELSVYHLESAIAAEHCLAPDFPSTNWQTLLDLYDHLLERKPTPIVQLNRAILLAQTGPARDAIDAILEIPDLDELLKHHYIYNAVLGTLYADAAHTGNTTHTDHTAHSGSTTHSGPTAQAHNISQALRLLKKAADLTSSISEKNRLQEKIASLQ